MARAPFRLGLAGGGTDVSPYCDQHGGCVLNATVDLYAYARCAPEPDDVVLESVDQELRWAVGVDKFGSGAPSALPLHFGVYQRMIRDFSGGRALPLRLTTASEVPAGSGLGASSTMVVAMIKAMAEYMGVVLDEGQIARLAVDIERNQLQLAGGLQDQYAAAFGGVNFIEFFANQEVVVNPLRIQRNYLAEIESMIMLYYTGVSRASAAIIDEQKENTERNRSDTINALHELKANALELKAALVAGNIPEFGRVFSKGWDAKRRLAAGVSNSRLEKIFRAAVDAGAIGGKLSGAGGGGFILFLVDPLDRARVEVELANLGGRVFNAHFVEAGAECWLRQDGNVESTLDARFRRAATI